MVRAGARSPRTLHFILDSRESRLLACDNHGRGEGGEAVAKKKATKKKKKTM